MKLCNNETIIQAVITITAISLVIVVGIFFMKNISLIQCPAAIPSQETINYFCKYNGYKYGWLSSSSCGADEVQCYRSFGDAEFYDCLKWNVTKIRLVS